MLETEVEKFRTLFPVVNRRIYFNHAGTGPLPLPVVRAISRFCARASTEGAVPYAEAERMVERTRRLVARLMGVRPGEVAFVKNTSSGLIIALGAIRWERDDNLIMMKDGFPANTYPYHLLLPEVEKRFVTSAELCAGPECVFRLVDEHTRAVAVEWVHFLSGARFDIQALGRFCRERGIYLIIDGIQGLGAIEQDFSVTGADFVAAGGGKWLLAPQGIGVLYINARTLAGLKPFNLGWLSGEWDEFNDCFTPRPLKKGARRYEEGTKNYLGIYGLAAALKILLGFGMANVTRRINYLVGRLEEGLRELGFDFLTPPEGRRAGILTVRRAGADMVGLQRRLEEAGVTVSVRENWLRIAPHFYNSESEVARFLNLVKIVK